MTLGKWKRRAAFLDRDGTIFENQGFVNTEADARGMPFVPGAVGKIQQLESLGFAPVIITNQGGVGRGFLTEETLGKITDVLACRLYIWGIRAPTFYCPHDPDAGCACRKPKPGLILRAAEELDLDISASIMIGDRQSDVDAGKAAGCQASYLLGPERWAAFDLSRPAG
jgi:histidinol-phosphate phosphatase family protein